MATPLHRKLGYKPGFRAHLFEPPEHYADLLEGVADNVVFVHRPDAASLDLVHAFTAERSVLAAMLPVFRALIKPDGMIWVSWPKKASGVPSDVDGNAIRAEAFPLGLVDVKVCSVDSVWSGLKVVVRKELRP